MTTKYKQLSLFRLPPRRQDTARRELERFVRRASSKGWSRARLAGWLRVSTRQLYRYLNGSSRVHPLVYNTVRAVRRITNTEIEIGA